MHLYLNHDKAQVKRVTYHSQGLTGTSREVECTAETTKQPVKGKAAAQPWACNARGCPRRKMPR